MLIIALLIPLLVGAISAALSSDGMAIYGAMKKPPLSPPSWVFSVAWTILYIMMGAASYLILISETSLASRATALILYCIQLTMNFLWSIIFFNWSAYLTSFIWLIVMWLLVIVCAVRFYSINRLATILFIPYILWLTFAAYLNLGTYFLSIDS